jgi:hypothetical protein
MVNIRNGYWVVEGCHRCNARSSFFSEESRAPVDDHVEGDHVWTYLGSSQAVKFDLACARCDRIVELDDMMGLMLSTCKEPECGVARIAAEAGPGTWVYVALCADSTHGSGRCVSSAGIQALSEYFNAGIKRRNKRVIVVPCIECKSIDTCQGIIIADTGLMEIY